MKKFLILAAAAASIGACTPREQNAGTGALIGAGTGAVVGGLATGRAGGAIIGSAATPPSTCYGRDEWGRRVAYAC